jgi:hypothetical protein
MIADAAEMTEAQWMALYGANSSLTYLTARLYADLLGYTLV